MQDALIFRDGKAGECRLLFYLVFYILFSFLTWFSFSFSEPVCFLQTFMAADNGFFQFVEGFHHQS